MTGNSQSSVITVSSTYDILLFEIDSKGRNQCDLLNKKDITTTLNSSNYIFNIGSFTPLNFTVPGLSISQPLRSITVLNDTVSNDTEPICSNLSPIPTEEGIQDFLVYMNYPAFIQLPIMCDAEQGSNLNYTLFRSDNSATPAWVQFNQTSRQITGIPYSGDNGTVRYKFVATDDQGM